MTLGVGAVRRSAAGAARPPDCSGSPTPAGWLAIVLLLLPLVPGLGTTINGARIWISVGPFSFQPGEVAKMLLVIAFAGYLVLHRDALALAGRRVLFIDLPRGRDLGPILLMWLVSLGVLVFQRDLGSSLLFFGLFVVMLYVATERAGWLVVGGGLFLGGAYSATASSATCRSRVDTWLDPFDFYSDAQGATSFQLVQSMFGMGWGGLLGRGLGGGMPDRIPFAESDFIVGAIGEELGLTGVMAVILIYGLIVERALRAALVCRDTFGKLVAVGLASVVALQVFVVIGGVTRLIPLTGLTTPFLSYGGSSLVANWVIDRAAAAHLRPCPPPGTVAVHRRRRRQEATQVVKMQVDEGRRPDEQAHPHDLGLLRAAVPRADGQRDLPAVLAGRRPQRGRRATGGSSRRRSPASAARSWSPATRSRESVESDDDYDFQRVYPTAVEVRPRSPAASPTTRQTGIEQSQNDVLSGDDSRLFVNRLVDLVNGNQHQGRLGHADHRPRAQTAAYDGLRALGPDVQGAVVALEPATGEVLADGVAADLRPQPARLPRLRRRCCENYDRLNEDPAKPLLNRGIQTTLPPGSTFKLVTAAAAIESGTYDARRWCPAGATYQLPADRAARPA